MTPKYVLNEESELRKKTFCIIDEASMVGEALGSNIDHFGCPVVAFGDQYQLGPVDDKPHFDLENADIKLTKVFRQDADSEILAFATCIREERCQEFQPRGQELRGRTFSKMNNDDIRKWMVGADQIICATNNTRRALNRRMLTYLSLAEAPFPKGREEEKLICLGSYPHLGLLNGSFVRVRSVSWGDEADRFFTANIERGVGGGKWEDCGEARIWKGGFEHTYDGVSEQMAKELRRDDTSAAIAYKDHDDPGVWLDWAWAVTTHKAQGNEWDKVLLIMESWPGKNNADLRMRMHYTGVTRARKQLRLIFAWGDRPNRA